MLDLLSDILSQLSVEGTLYFRTSFTPPFGVKVPPFENVARFHYAHRGTCRVAVAGQPKMAAERRYFWAQDLSVYFEDGRFFHRVPAEGGTAHHWCDPDRYTLVYDFSGWPRFTVDWRVTGPRKNYSAHTSYCRLSG